MDAPEIVRAEPSAADVRALEDLLYEFNAARTGIDDGALLALFARDAEGAMLAGAAGHTWGGTGELRQLWVHPELRRRGLGRRLVAEFGAEVARRGCDQLVLSTHSFQAPDFYRRLGFEEIGRIPDYPRGHAQIFFRKRLP
jgi:ribosomal protein S18 acetylase RimI-like enzyme